MSMNNTERKLEKYKLKCVIYCINFMGKTLNGALEDLFLITKINGTKVKICTHICLLTLLTEVPLTK